VARWCSGAGHGRDKDPFELEADIDATRELVKIVGIKLAEVFVYSGDRHLFAGSSLPSYDADVAAPCAALTSSSTGRAIQDNDSTAVPGAKGFLTSFRELTYEGPIVYCDGTGNCATRNNTLTTAKGHDSMTGLGAPGPAFIADLSGL
jgi:hypothetical protein